MRALRQRNNQGHHYLSEGELQALARELIAKLPAERLDAQLDAITGYCLNHHQQVRALLDPQDRDHHEQWQSLIRRIRMIARHRGFGQISDGAIDLEDLVQLVCAEVVTSLDNYYYESSLETWLHSVTLRRLRRFQRDQGAAKRSAEREPLDAAEELPDPQAHHDARVFAAELLARIEAILLREKRGKRLYQIFVLRVLEDRSTEEIGALIHLHPSRVRVLLNAAREALRRGLGPEDIDAAPS